MVRWKQCEQIRITNQLRKMEELLTEKWDLKEDLIAAYGGYYLSNADEIVNDTNRASSSANRGQSFHSGEVRSSYMDMDCTSKKIIYEVISVENHRNVNRNTEDPNTRNFHTADSRGRTYT